MTFRQHLYAFVKLGRPLFLAGGVIMHVLGVTAAVYNGARFNGQVFLLGQLGITAIQWMTHYSNEYFDQEADQHNTAPTRWSGGSRVLTLQLLSSHVALITAYLLAAMALIAVAILTFLVHTGPLTLPLFGMALFLAWFYSAPPLRLHSTGAGEVSASLLVAGLTPLTGYYLQSGRLDLLPFLLVIPLVFFQTAMLLTIEFADVAGDAAAGKNTLVVRLGIARSVWLHRGVLGLAYLTLPLFIVVGLPALVALMAMLTSPFAIWQVLINRSVPLNLEDANRTGFISIALLMGTALLEMLALLIMIGLRP